MRQNPQNEAFFSWLRDTSQTATIMANTQPGILYVMFCDWHAKLEYPLDKKYPKYPLHVFLRYVGDYIKGVEVVVKPVKSKPIEVETVNKRRGRKPDTVLAEPTPVEPIPEVVLPAPVEMPEVEEELPLPKPVHLQALTEEEAFQQVVDYAGSVADQSSQDYFLIISGDSGLGKTWEVKETLKSAIGIEAKERYYGQQPTGQYEWIEGPSKIPPKELYCFLYKENNRVILLDDADDVICNGTNINMFKKVLDSVRVRKVGYGGKPILVRRGGHDGDDYAVPNTFEFTGRIIVITNLYFNQLDTALVSRALVVEIDLPYAETVKRVERLLPNLLLDTPEATMKIKREVVTFLKGLKNIPKLDLRTTEQAIRERIRNPDKWEKLVERSIIIKGQKKNQ